ncbi:hypothetical protein N0V88_007520 [Collariella sp. IMI 366227]|nr:hypothetical protein N0V88_007520 [Collariella sp. IMI 366227]
MLPDFVIPSTFKAVGIDSWKGIWCVTKLMLLIPVKDDAETQLWFQIADMLLKVRKEPYDKFQPYMKHRPLEEQMKTLEISPNLERFSQYLFVVDYEKRPPAAAALGLAEFDELDFLDFHTLDKIAKYIVDAHHQANEAILVFPWLASEVPSLTHHHDDRLVELDQPKARRFEYDYQSKLVYLDIMSESEFHYQFQAGLRDYLKDGVTELLGATEDPTLRKRIRAIVRRARHKYDPIQFSMEVGDNVEHPSEQLVRDEERKEAERRVAEARNEAEQLVRDEERKEAERRVAEVRNEARIEMDRWMAGMEWRMNAEIERRVAGRRLEIE